MVINVLAFTKQIYYRSYDYLIVQLNDHFKTYQLMENEAVIDLFPY